MAEEVNRILVDRGMALGDSLMGSAVLKPLREKYPDAQIDYNTAFPEIFAPDYRDYPYANLTRSPDTDDKYDLVFHLGHIPENVLEYRASFIHLCCNEVGVRFNEPEIFGSAIHTPYNIGVIPTTGRPGDTIPPEKMQELIDRLTEDGHRCISFGAKDAPRFDHCWNEYPKYSMGEDSPDRNDWGYGAPKMSTHVNFTARIMKGLDVVVAGDTGLFHVAATVLTPTVLFLTSGSPETDFWSGSRYSKIVRSGTSDVADISVDQLYWAVRKVLFEINASN